MTTLKKLFNSFEMLSQGFRCQFYWPYQFCFGIIWTLGVACVGAQTPFLSPIGVPNPVWGSGWSPIDIERPEASASWPGTPENGFFYINSGKTGATDADNPFGCPERPRVSVPSSLPAGSVVFVEKCQTTVALTAAQGTPEKPIWIVGTGAGLCVTPGGALSVSGSSSYVIIDGLDFDGSSEGYAVDFS